MKRKMLDGQSHCQEICTFSQIKFWKKSGQLPITITENQKIILQKSIWTHVWSKLLSHFADMILDKIILTASFGTHHRHAITEPETLKLQA